MTATTTAARRRARDSGSPQRPTDLIGNRLRRAAGQLGGVLAMHEEGRRPTEILDQIAATRAALDAVALLVIDDYATACAGPAPTPGETVRMMTDLTTTVRRYLRSH